MRILKVDLGRNHEVALFGDQHEGSAMQNEQAVDDTVNYIASTEKCYAILMGDYCEAKSIDHPHYQHEVHKKQTVLEQYMTMKKKLQPIAPKCLVALEGNHDWRLSRRIGNTVKTMICEDLNIPFGGYSTVVWVMADGEVLYKIYATHGSGSITSRIDDPDERRHSMERALKRKLFLKFGDALVMASGHNHRLIVKAPTGTLELKTAEKFGVGIPKVKSFYSNEVYEVAHGYIPPSNRWYVATGGFLRLYADDEEITGYAEVAGLDPLEVGYAKIVCKHGYVENIEKIVLG